MNLFTGLIGEQIRDAGLENEINLNQYLIWRIEPESSPLFNMLDISMNTIYPEACCGCGGPMQYGDVEYLSGVCGYCETSLIFDLQHPLHR